MIYLDNAATTKPSETALQKAAVFNTENYYNPSALYHGGISASEELKQSRTAILNALGTVKHEVVFNSCGSEADNTAIFGSVKRGVFITTEGEHSAVYKSAMELKNRGINVIFAPLNSDGTVKIDELLKLVNETKPTLVSIVHVNNETGGINDINAIAKSIKAISPKTLFHSDGVQAFGKIKFNLSKEIDMYSVSAHKINGLKGTGALIKIKNLNLPPLIYGGGQEGGQRSGTENVFGIKVFEYALKERFSKIDEFNEKVTALKNAFSSILMPSLFQTISSNNGSPYILTVSAVGLRGEVVMHSLEEFGIVVGNGSACSSKNRFSRVVSACGYKENVLDGLIRVSFSPYNTMEEITFAANKLNETVEKLSKIMK